MVLKSFPKSDWDLHEPSGLLAPMLNPFQYASAPAQAAAMARRIDGFMAEAKRGSEKSTKRVTSSQKNERNELNAPRNAEGKHKGNIPCSHGLCNFLHSHREAARRW